MKICTDYFKLYTHHRYKDDFDKLVVSIVENGGILKVTQDTITALNALGISLCAMQHEKDGADYRECPIRPRNLACGHMAANWRSTMQDSYAYGVLQRGAMLTQLLGGFPIEKSIRYNTHEYSIMINPGEAVMHQLKECAGSLESIDYGAGYAYRNPNANINSRLFRLRIHKDLSDLVYGLIDEGKAMDPLKIQEEIRSVQSRVANELEYIRDDLVVRLRKALRSHES